jgi:hypothetical protein
MSVEASRDRLTESQAVEFTTERLKTTFDFLGEHKLGPHSLLVERTQEGRLFASDDFGWQYSLPPSVPEDEREKAEEEKFQKGRILKFELRHDKDNKHISYAMIRGQLPAVIPKELASNSLTRADVWCARILVPPNRYLDSPPRAILDTWILPTTQILISNFDDTSLRWDKEEARIKAGLVGNLILMDKPDVVPIGAIAVKHTSMRSSNKNKLLDKYIEKNLREVLDKFDQGARDFLQRAGNLATIQDSVLAGKS